MKSNNNISINENYGNQTMEFTFSNKRLYQNLVFGILWLGIGISYFLSKMPNGNTNLILSSLWEFYILFYLYMSSKVNILKSQVIEL